MSFRRVTKQEMYTPAHAGTCHGTIYYYLQWVFMMGTCQGAQGPYITSRQQTAGSVTVGAAPVLLQPACVSLLCN